MDLFAAWLVFPTAVVVVALGSGLLLERSAGRALPGPLVVPAGFALILALVTLLTSSSRFGGLVLGAVMVMSVSGFALGIGRLREARPDRWAVIAAVAVFAVFGAPAALSGEPTFSGSLVLPDTSNQLQLAQRLADSGPEFESLPESSYKVSLTKYLSSQYPVGAQASLGVLAPLGFSQIAWLYQPFLALMMAMAALSLYSLLRAWSQRPALSAAGAFLAAQPAVTYSYALQGSIKELAGLSMLCLVVALVAAAVSSRASARAFLPIGVACVAMIDSLGLAAGTYLAIPVLVLVTPWAWRVVKRRRLREVLWAAAVTLIALILLQPFLSGASVAYEVGSAVLLKAQDIGNLAAPLKTFQGLGVWLGTDFRYPAEHHDLTVGLSVLVAVTAVLGVVAALRRRAFGPLLLIGTLVPISLYLLYRGSPYADGKVLAIAAPAPLLAAFLGVAILADTRLRLVGILAGALLAGGVIGSNVLAYHGVQNAPQERYAELLRINDRFAGGGPTLFTEYDEHSGYLLRDVQVHSEPEFPLGYRVDRFRKPSGLNDPRHRPSVKSALDLDDLTLSFVESHPLIVTRRSPTVSRPPANYQRVYSGRYYAVWERQPRDDSVRVRAHLPQGADVLSPSAVPRCGDLRSLARRASRTGGRLAFVRRPSLSPVSALAGPAPAGWVKYSAYPQSLVMSGPGRIERRVKVYQGGDYRVWLTGSFARAVHVEVDGRSVGSVSYEPGNPGQYFPLARLRLGTGTHRITVRRSGGDLRPGDGGGAKSSLTYVGPVVLSPEANESPRVETASPREASRLCGQRLDWLEIVEPGRS